MNDLHRDAKLACADDQVRVCGSTSENIYQRRKEESGDKEVC